MPRTIRKKPKKVQKKFKKVKKKKPKKVQKKFKKVQKKKPKKVQKKFKKMIRSPAFIAGSAGTAAALGGLFALNEKWYSDYVKKRKKRTKFQKLWTRMSGKNPPITPYEDFMGYRKRYKTSKLYEKIRKEKNKKKFGKKVSKKPSVALRKMCKRLKVRLTVKRNGKRVYKSEKVLKKQCKNAMKRKK